MIRMVQPNNIYRLGFPCAATCAVFPVLAHLILMQTRVVGTVINPILLMGVEA